MKMLNAQVEETMMSLSQMVAKESREYTREQVMVLLDSHDRIVEMLINMAKEFKANDVETSEDVEKMSVTFTGQDALMSGRALTVLLAVIKSTRLDVSEFIMDKLVSAHESMRAINSGHLSPISMEDILKD